MAIELATSGLLPSGNALVTATHSATGILVLFPVALEAEAEDLIAKAFKILDSSQEVETNDASTRNSDG